MSAKAEGKKEAKNESVEEQREMSFEEVKDFFAKNRHLPEAEEYDAIELYKDFDEYKNHIYSKQGGPTGADIAFFADLEEALRVSAEIEKEIQEE